MPQPALDELINQLAQKLGSARRSRTRYKPQTLPITGSCILWADGLRPGRMHDVTAARAAGITDCFRHSGLVEVLLDDGYLGLSCDHPGKAVTLPRKPRPGALVGRAEQWERDRHEHSSDRMTVENALTDHKRLKPLMRWTHRGARLSDTYQPSLATSPTAQPPSVYRTRPGQT